MTYLNYHAPNPGLPAHKLVLSSSETMQRDMNPCQFNLQRSREFKDFKSPYRPQNSLFVNCVCFTDANMNLQLTSEIAGASK